MNFKAVITVEFEDADMPTAKMRVLEYLYKFPKKAKLNCASLELSDNVDENKTRTKE